MKKHTRKSCYQFMELDRGMRIACCILISWLLACTGVHSASVPKPTETSTHSKSSSSPMPGSNNYKLNTLIKVETVVMQGNKPSYTLYIPVPQNWEVNAIDLNLIIQRSPILENDSTLTLFAGDVPINSIFVAKDNKQTILWNVSIPKEYITSKVTTIRINGFLKTGDIICQDTENKGEWVAISGNSEVIYHYNKSNLQPALLSFPAPFIHQDAPFKDVITMLLPNHLNDKSFFPYLKLANIFSQKASWRGVDFNLYPANGLGKNTSGHPAVLAATADNADFTAIGQPSSLRLQNKHWVNMDGTALPADTGFVWLTQYQDQPLMVISANSSEGLNNAIQSIRTGMMQKMVNHPSFFLIQNKTNMPYTPYAQSKMTLSDLGYEDSVVYGTGQNAESFQFNVPSQFHGKNNYVNLVYSNSPFLEKARISSMSVSLNGIPIGGVELVPYSSDIRTLRIPLPVNHTFVGRNNLTINFALILPNAKCATDHLNQAWGIIYKNSSFEFSKEGTLDSSLLKNWTSLLANEVLISLPSDEEVYKNIPLMNNMILFSSKLKDDLSLDLLNPGKPIDSSNNVLVFSTAHDQSSAKEHLKQSFDSLLVSLKNTQDPVLNDIDKSVFQNAFVKSQDVGFANVWQDETNSNSHRIILYGYSPKDLNLALNLLNNNFKTELLKGDLAVSFKNGSYTSLELQDISSQTTSESMMHKVTKVSSNTLLYILLFVILLIIILALKALRRK